MMEFPHDGSPGATCAPSISATTLRLGTPEEFGNLVDAFHHTGIGWVILDEGPGISPTTDMDSLSVRRHAHLRIRGYAEGISSRLEQPVPSITSK
ncbi:MAG: hypothetical protein IPI66_15465 [Chitinophagaceae bacterium]|nr:hypothetical protein [Chitinophagaceae bacterium]